MNSSGWLYRGNFYKMKQIDKGDTGKYNKNRMYVRNRYENALQSAMPDVLENHMLPE